VQPNDGDPPSDTPCDFQALETCTAVLVE
jgi:hypothetical protein